MSTQHFKQFLCLVVVSTVASFRLPDSVEPDAFVHWCKEHKSQFTREQQNGDVLYSVTFVPKELLLIREAQKASLDEKEYLAYAHTLAHSSRFLLHISVPSAGTREFLLYEPDNSKSYNDKLNYFSFKMQQDIVMVADGKDTISCDDYLFERSFSLSPNGTFSLGFTLPKKYKTLNIIVNNNGFDQQSIQFLYNRKDLENLPKLKKYTQWNQAK